jgi:5'-3' exonuclease
MGIKKLNKFLMNHNNNIIFKYKNLLELSKSNKDKEYQCFNTIQKPMVLGIDVSLYLHKFIYSHNDHIYGFVNQILKLLSNKIIPLYVFDGIPPQEKNNTISYRSDKKNKIKDKIKILYNSLDHINNQTEIKNVNKKIKQLTKQIINIKKSHITDLKNLFSIMNVPYISSSGEADAMFGKLYKHKIINACLSEDMDILIFGCDRLIKMANGIIYEYNLPNILNKLQLNKKQFIDMCLLFGCDYIRPIPRTNPSMLYDIIKKHRTIENAINHIDNDKCKELLDSYLNARNIFMTYSDKEFIPYNFSTKIKNKIDYNNVFNFINSKSNMNIEFLNSNKIKSKIKNNILHINTMINSRVYY